MSVTLKIDNFGSSNLKQFSRLAADANPSDVQVTLESTEGYFAGDFVILGPRGTDTAEPLTIQAVNDATHVTFSSGITLHHDQGNELISLFADQIQVYSAPNVDNSQPPDARFTVVASPFNITVYKSWTMYADNASVDTWYKYAYYNSITHQSTDIKNSFAARSGTIDYCSLDDIRSEAGYRNNKWVTDAEIATKRKQAQAHIDGVLQSSYTVPFPSPVNATIEKICTQLAAGYLQQKDYGIFASGSSKDGSAREARAETMLQAINTRDEIIVDYNGDNIALQYAGSTQGYPMNDQSDMSDNGNDRIFDMSKIY
jgi:phage gp36-like protein